LAFTTAICLAANRRYGGILGSSVACIQVPRSGLNEFAELGWQDRKRYRFYTAIYDSGRQDAGMCV